MLLSIVIPIYNEEEVLPLLRTRLDQVLSQLDCRVEVVLVDDGSQDQSVAILEEITRLDARYKAVILSRNYGHQIALSAGLDLALGDAVVVLDADLQDPPELIPEMMAHWQDGYHVVYGKRIKRDGETWLKKVTAALFYRFIRRLSGVDIPENVGDFRLMDRKVVDALKNMPENFRFIRGMVAWVGFKQIALPFERPPRAAGETKYPWKKMFNFALDAIFSFSTIPIRMTTYIGLIITAASIVEALRNLYLRLFTNDIIPGYTSLFIAVLLLGGLNLFFMGVLGEYVGRVFIESKRRPLYLIQDLLTSQKENHDV